MKKKKILKLLKKQQQQSKFNYYYWILLWIPLLIYLVYPTTIPKTYQSMPRLIMYKNVNTTSLPYSQENAWYNPKALSILLEKHLKTNNDLYVVCMHHLDLKRPYRACSFINREYNIAYFMLNPKIIRKYGTLNEYEENSQSCNDTIKSKRHSCIQVNWFDGQQEIQSNLCDEVAISLQLNIDEFEGNQHCSFYLKSKT